MKPRALPSSSGPVYHVSALLYRLHFLGERKIKDTIKICILHRKTQAGNEWRNEGLNFQYRISAIFLYANSCIIFKSLNSENYNDRKGKLELMDRQGAYTFIPNMRAGSDLASPPSNSWFENKRKCSIKPWEIWGRGHISWLSPFESLCPQNIGIHRGPEGETRTPTQEKWSAIFEDALFNIFFKKW